MNLIVPSIKFRHVTISQAVGVCFVASRPSLVVICLKKFRKEFVVLEGHGPGARDNAKVITELWSSQSWRRLAPAPGFAPPMLLVSPQPASQIFSISHRSHFFSLNIILSLDT